jgi:hypothetical protein
VLPAVSADAAVAAILPEGWPTVPRVDEMLLGSGTAGGPGTVRGPGSFDRPGLGVPVAPSGRGWSDAGTELVSGAAAV